MAVIDQFKKSLKICIPRCENNILDYYIYPQKSHHRFV